MSTVLILDSNSAFVDALTPKLKKSGFEPHNIQTDFVTHNTQNGQQKNAVAIVNINLKRDERKDLRVNRIGMKLARDLFMSEIIRFHGGILLLSFEPEENIKACVSGDLLKSDACVYLQLPRDFSEIFAEVTKLQNHALSDADRISLVKRLSMGELINLLRGFKHNCENLSGALNSAIEGISRTSSPEMKLRIFTSLQQSIQADDISKRVKECEQISTKLVPVCTPDVVNKFVLIQSLLISTQEKYDKFLSIVSLPFDEPRESAIVKRGREIVVDLGKIEEMVKEIISYFQEESSNA